jgi:hypothetical protein
MPEKIADKVETNGATRPMPEKVAETSRRYIREAEKAGENAFRMSNDLMTTTTNYYFDAIDKTIHDSMELTMRAERAMGDMMTIYRQTYMDGIKSWQAYWQDINKTLVRTR